MSKFFNVLIKSFTCVLFIITISVSIFYIVNQYDLLKILATSEFIFLLFTPMLYGLFIVTTNQRSELFFRLIKFFSISLGVLTVIIYAIYHYNS